MVFYNGQTVVPSGPTLVPDVRAHIATWRRFRKITGAWPTLSMITFIMRFVIMIIGVTIAVAYAERHSLGKGEGLLICFSLLLPTLFGWFLIETGAWNYELRRKGVGSKADLWLWDQFPQDRK